MKRLRTLALVALVAVFGIAMTACSGSGYNNKEARELVKKANKGKLKKADYTTILGWYETATEELLDQYEKLIKEYKDYDDFSLAATEMTKRFESKYPHLDALTGAMFSAAEEDMGAANYKKFQKLQEKFEKKWKKLSEKFPESDSDESAVSEEPANDSDIVWEEPAVEVAAPAEVYEEYADSAVAM